MQVLETQILQFAIDVIQPEAVGDRRIDFHGLAGDALAFVVRHGFQRAHIVQTIGQLDENDTHIVRHCQQHFAKIFCLRIFAGLKQDAVQFAQPIDQFRNRFTEFFGNLFGGGVGIFHHVMQQCGNDRLNIEVQGGQDARDSNRVGDIRIAGLARLALVRGAAEFDRLADVLDVLRFKVGGGFLDKQICVGHTASRY